MTNQHATWLNYAGEFMRRDAILAALEEQHWLLKAEVRAVRAEIAVAKPIRNSSMETLLKINQQIYERSQEKK